MAKPKLKIDEAAAGKAVGFIQSLTHTVGKWSGRPFQLLDWQHNKVIVPLFGTLKPNGLRRFNSCYVEIPKKNGKSELAAAVSLKLLCADGEESAEVYSAANDREQAGIIFRTAAKMVRQNAALSKRCKIIDSQKTIIYKRDSFYKALSADVPNKEGFNIHGLVIDEVHAMKNREFFDVLTDGAGDARAQPLFFFITTAGQERTIDNVCWELHTHGKEVLAGKSQDESFLPVIFGLKDDDDWEDEANWYKANPSLGHILDIEKFREAYRRAKEMPARQANFRRRRCNQWVKAFKTWIPNDKWDATAGITPPLSQLRGRACFGGLDLASNVDFTALVLVFPNDDGSMYVLCYFWLPEETLIKRQKDDPKFEIWRKQGFIQVIDGAVIDNDAVFNKIDELAQYFDIREIAYDRWGANDISRRLDENGMTVVPFAQSTTALSPGTKEVERLTLEKKLIHGGNPVLSWMQSNVTLKEDSNDNRKPDKKRSTEKIDGIIGLVMAVDRATRHQDESKSVYDSEGEEAAV